MNRFRHLALPTVVGVLLVACGPTADDPSAAATPTPHDMASMTDPPALRTQTMPAGPSPDATTGPSVEVDIANFAFEPAELTIRPGTEVVFTNSDAAPHTVTAGSDDAPMPDRFDSGLLQPGDVFRFVFEESGEYAYFCERHPPMTGVIVVEP